MTREDPQMKLRLPAELKDKLAAAAAENGRSLNAEVTQRLEESFLSTGPSDVQTLAAFKSSLIVDLLKALDDRDRRRRKT